MSNIISYGPHIFPGGPEYYIKTGELETTIQKAHEDIEQTLIASFSSDVSDSLINQLSKQLGIDTNAPVKIAFMNYGSTQLVYLATIKNQGKFAALINQTQIPLGKVKKEFENLKRLAEIDPRFVVKPFAHFVREEKGHELYVSEYIENALCIAHIDDAHGIYDPLPHYHFERFLPEMSSEINKGIIALLVNYYDEEKKKGLAETQISGNDFLLTRDMEMKIIGAREYMDISFDDYLDILREEFIVGTYKDTDEVISGKIKVNHRSKKPMTIKEVEEGIGRGMKIREKRIKNI